MNGMRASSTASFGLFTSLTVGSALFSQQFAETAVKDEIDDITQALKEKEQTLRTELEDSNKETLANLDKLTDEELDEVKGEE